MRKRRKPIGFSRSSPFSMPIKSAVPLPSSFKPWNSLTLTDTPNPTYEPAEQLIQATGADIRFGGNRAFYSLGGRFHLLCRPSRLSSAVPITHRFARACPLERSAGRLGS